LLALVSSWGEDDLSRELGLTAGRVTFVVFAASVGTRFKRRYSIHLELPRERPLSCRYPSDVGTLSTGGEIGLAAIIGALAGLVSPTEESFELQQQARPSTTSSRRSSS
jgi:hypothetical protein